MRGFCHGCNSSNVKVELHDNIALCARCLKKVKERR